MREPRRGASSMAFSRGSVIVAGRVHFEEARCKGCGVCVSVCPKHIIALDESRTNAKGYHPAGVKEMQHCIACAACAKLCPDSVIRVERLGDTE